MSTDREQYRSGIVYTLSAYGIWGIAPIYFHALAGVTPLEILCHRVFWSVLFLFGLLAARGELGATLALLRQGRAVRTLLLSSALVCCNWLLFIYAIATQRTLEASFGYFVNPLFTVALGVIVLRERLSRLQLVCLALAASGVLVQAVALGSLPWIALGLAVSFGLYALVRKQAGIPPLHGLAVETLLAAPAALAGFFYFAQSGQLAFGASVGTTTTMLLVAAGLITSTPLVLFVAGTQRLPLAMVGFLQYLAPTGQFLVAVIGFGEPLSATKLVSFALIWASLLLLMIGPRLARLGRAAALSERAHRHS